MIENVAFGSRPLVTGQIQRVGARPGGSDGQQQFERSLADTVSLPGPSSGSRQRVGGGILLNAVAP
jgi:hypothetical protein